MDDRKELTKNLIASGVKELMLTQNFEKLTIRMIAEKAGIIRPTFYYHFQDKYEVLEWIVQSQLLDPVRVMFERGMIDEALKLIFATIDDDKEFYRKAFDVTGQNSFWEIMISCIRKFISDNITVLNLFEEPNSPVNMTTELVALHFAFNLAGTINLWIKKAPDLSAESISSIYKYLNTHSFFDMINPAE